MTMAAKRLLCVDDEPYMLKTLQRFFRNDGYELFFAGSGIEAMAILERVTPIQVILSDFQMPGLNGLEFIRRVKSRRPYVVGIILTGYADLQQLGSALDEGCIFDLVPKPWDRAVLRRSVARAMDQYEIDTAADVVADADK